MTLPTLDLADRERGSHDEASSGVDNRFARAMLRWLVNVSRDVFPPYVRPPRCFEQGATGGYAPFVVELLLADRIQLGQVALVDRADVTVHAAHVTLNGAPLTVLHAPDDPLLGVYVVRPASLPPLRLTKAHRRVLRATRMKSSKSSCSAKVLSVLHRRAFVQGRCFLQYPDEGIGAVVSNVMRRQGDGIPQRWADNVYVPGPSLLDHVLAVGQEMGIPERDHRDRRCPWVRQCVESIVWQSHTWALTPTVCMAPPWLVAFRDGLLVLDGGPLALAALAGEPCLHLNWHTPAAAFYPGAVPKTPLCFRKHVDAAYADLFLRTLPSGTAALAHLVRRPASVPPGLPPVVLQHDNPDYRITRTYGFHIDVPAQLRLVFADVIFLVAVLNHTFGAGYGFAPEVTPESGIRMCRWPGCRDHAGHRPPYKTMRLYMRGWPAALSHTWDTSTHREPCQPQHSANVRTSGFRTFLKAYYGAPVWTLAEVQAMAACVEYAWPGAVVTQLPLPIYLSEAHGPDT